MTGTKERPNANSILALMRDDDFSDSWGTAMSWAYGVAEVLYDADPNMVPVELQYRPSLAGPEVPYDDTRGIPGGGLIYNPEHIPRETNMVWEWLHGEHYQEPKYWDDPTFEARANELVRTAKMLHRYLDWCRAAGRDY